MTQITNELLDQIPLVFVVNEHGELLRSEVRLTGEISTHPSHNCLDSANTCYFFNEFGVGRRCSMCDKVTDFQHRSVWLRIKQVFTKDANKTGTFND